MIELLLLATALPLVLGCGYLLLLTALSRRLPGRRLGLPAEPPRMLVVVPAHQEESGIRATVAAIWNADYPRSRMRLVVVADNCTDWTAPLARVAGAEVWERHDPRRRGKGYALAFAFDRALREGWADAVVVLDADTRPEPRLLRAFASRLAAGARAMQGRNAVLNPHASWRTGLMAIGFSAFHDVRSFARERLGLSCGLRGNGMCFSTALLAADAAPQGSLTEDVEQGLRLGLGGTRVEYVHEAEARSEMPAGERAARSQRRRWEGGRRELSRRMGPRLIREAVRRRDPMLLDLALDLLVPPLGTLALASALGLALALALRAPVASAAFGFCLASLLAHVARGWMLSGTGVAGLAALGRVPLYLAWKVWVRFVPGDASRSEWVRTARRGEAP